MSIKNAFNFNQILKSNFKLIINIYAVDLKIMPAILSC